MTVNWGAARAVLYAASLVSAFPVVGVDIHNEKLDLAKKFGVSHTLLSNSQNFEKDLNEIFDEKGPDVIFETTGSSKIMEKAYELTPSNGKTVFVGVPNDKISIYTLPLAFNKSLLVSQGGQSIPDLDIPRYIRLVKNNKINFSNLITNEFKLRDINKAIDLFRTGKAGRIVIIMSEKEI